MSEQVKTTKAYASTCVSNATVQLLINGRYGSDKN